MSLYVYAICFDSTVFDNQELTAARMSITNRPTTQISRPHSWPTSTET